MPGPSLPGYAEDLGRHLREVYKIDGEMQRRLVELFGPLEVRELPPLTWRERLRRWWDTHRLRVHRGACEDRCILHDEDDW